MRRAFNITFGFEFYVVRGRPFPLFVTLTQVDESVKKGPPPPPPPFVSEFKFWDVWVLGMSYIVSMFTRHVWALKDIQLGSV